MSTLLKDLPQHKERIENNMFLEQDIRDILSQQASYSSTNERLMLLEDEFSAVAEFILEKLANFVNENYEWKGIKA